MFSHNFHVIMHKEAHFPLNNKKKNPLQIPTFPEEFPDFQPRKQTNKQTNKYYINRDMDSLHNVAMGSYEKVVCFYIWHLYFSACYSNCNRID